MRLIVETSERHWRLFPLTPNKDIPLVLHPALRALRRAFLIWSLWVLTARSYFRNCADFPPEDAVANCASNCRHSRDCAAAFAEVNTSAHRQAAAASRICFNQILKCIFARTTGSRHYSQTTSQGRVNPCFSMWPFGGGGKSELTTALICLRGFDHRQSCHIDDTAGCDRGSENVRWPVGAEQYRSHMQRIGH